MAHEEGGSGRRTGKEPINEELLYSQGRHFSQQAAADTVTKNTIFTLRTE